MGEKKARGQFARLTALLAALLIALAVMSLCVGAVPLFPTSLFSALADRKSAEYRILAYVRLPRIAAAVLCGSSLASAGLLVQATLQNPLGSPNVLGMNAGAGLAVVGFSAAGIISAWSVPLAAFAGAFLSLVLVTSIAKKAGGTSKGTLILSGIAANAFLTALTDGMNSLFPDTIYARSAFRIGSLAETQADVMAAAATVALLASAAAILMRNSLDILSLGDDTARSLGLNVGITRTAALVLAAILCGAGISVAGLVGFVGLIVPHCARMLCPHESAQSSRTGHLLVTSMILGAILVLFCDTLSRTIFSPYELPVGVMLSVLGGLFFFHLLLKKHKGSYDKN